MEASKKPIDAVAMMRELRDQMSREIEGMSYQEEQRYLRSRPSVEWEKEQEAEQKRPAQPLP